MPKIKELIGKPVSVHQAKDTGMAMVLLFLLIFIVSESQPFLWVALLCLLIDMTWPDFFKPCARIWLSLSHLMGNLMSKVVLGILFIGLVVPVGLARRLFARDSLQLKKWKKGKESVFRVRSDTFSLEDIRHPY